MKLVKEDNWSFYSAAKKFNIPKSTLLRKCTKNLEPGPGKFGPARIMTESEEQELVNWVLDSAKMGDRRTKTDIRDAAAFIIENVPDRSFKNDYPGAEWLRQFLERRPAIKPEFLASHHKVFNPKTISTESFFEKVSVWLKEKFTEEELSGLKSDPNRWLIFDSSEFEFHLEKKTTKGSKYKIQVQTTVNYGISADGEVFNRTILFPKSFKIKISEIQSALKNEGEHFNINLRVLTEYFKFPELKFEVDLNHTHDGLQTADTFFDYIQKIDKQLNKQNVKRPVMLFASVPKPLVSYEARKFCDQSKIVLLTHFPKPVQLLQMLDKSIYSRDKPLWKKLLKDWKAEHPSELFSEISFIKLLEETNERVLTKDSVVKAYASTEIYPCDNVLNEIKT